MTILGSSSLPVDEIDLHSISLNGIHVSVKPNGKHHCDVEDVDDDGIDDITCHYASDQAEWQDLEDGDEISLTGKTIAGTEFVGYDEVCIKD